VLAVTALSDVLHFVDLSTSPLDGLSYVFGAPIRFAALMDARPCDAGIPASNAKGAGPPVTTESTQGGMCRRLASGIRFLRGRCERRDIHRHSKGRGLVS